MLYFLIYPLLGVFAGLLAGLFGIGGGIIVVPCLAAIFSYYKVFPYDLIMHITIGTSLAIMIITISSSLYAHHKHNYVLWKLFLRLLPGIAIGVIIGTACAKYLSTNILEILLGIFLLLISIRMLLFTKIKSSSKLPKQPWLSLISTIIGTISGLLGIGGGVMLIPFLTHCNIPTRQIPGTTSACTLVVAIIGTIGFILTGWKITTIPYSTGYIYWPAVLSVAIGSMLFVPVGVKLAAHLNIIILKRIFAIFLLLASINLLF